MRGQPMVESENFRLGTNPLGLAACMSDLETREGGEAQLLTGTGIQNSSQYLRLDIVVDLAWRNRDEGILNV
jgi:hypothetical protein